MASDIFRLIISVLRLGLPLLPRLLSQKLYAIYHKWVYKATPSAKNVVVLGGSFAGVELVKRLCDTLPTGYKVILIEQNSHFNFTFNFPRFSVLPGREHLLFIPYDGIARSKPDGIFTLVQGEAVGITENAIRLSSGGKVEFEYLAIATGSSSPPPAKLAAHNRDDACAEFQGLQKKIAHSNKIAVVGGGAVGIELAADVKTFYPDSDVTLIHSRDQLLPNFGKRLHDHVTLVFEQLGIRILLNERPELGSNTLAFSNGGVENFDLVIPCTGQRPNSKILTELDPDSISKESSRILVSPTLQVLHENNKFPHIFAFGDVAETGGPKMARASLFQGDIVARNIFDSIHGKPSSHVYKPLMELEGSIKLTLGKKKGVIYSMNDRGGDILVPIKGGKEELEIARAWGMLGMDISTARSVI
ncbi:FAD/NAD(P)-binding domain-containing protein [Periconia macrospinosa]|uniref:FAD/NAD(P)-binding domain-containing protein n=1 Tax=Periconia macrospinosa TaxID=97972 RepID=A0A2V1DDI7_9PLEO|nr:FAD/NAD(P)-binding domain-containing protein [Periconia macrospinosa]